ncbi:MAG: ribbon-helix-helix domain-containing protein [Oscillospiraceae bacterium]|nr:ribbon-helix-helix domain-containing protein [Oscillospiraceae bacterium]
MEYKTKSGSVITDSMIESLGDACEKSQYPGRPGAFVVAPVGRPPLCPSEDLVTVAFKIPRSQRERLDKIAARKDATRSEFLRDVLSEILQ